MWLAKAPVAVGLGAMTLASLVLLGLETLYDRELVHGYLAWNICLAWVPLLLAVAIRRGVRRWRWSSWGMLLLTLAWLTFLPNSFYIISDFVHLPELAANQLLLGVVVTASFACTGILLGLSSLYVVQAELDKRLPARLSGTIVGAILLLASGAIYIGRDLRWNSWDVLVSPFGLLFDVSERLLHPNDYAQVAIVVVPFFVLLSALYVTARQIQRSNI